MYRSDHARDENRTTHGISYSTQCANGARPRGRRFAHPLPNRWWRRNDCTFRVSLVVHVFHEPVTPDALTATPANRACAMHEAVKMHVTSP